MKKAIIIALAVTGISIVACENKENEHEEVAPAVVQAAFQEIFPNISDVEWEMENENEWEAEFEMDGVEYSANFLADGTWKETEHEITASEFPVAVQNTLSTDFADYSVEEAEFAETPDGIAYEFELTSSNGNLEVVMDADGFVSIEIEVTEDEDNDGE
jgi:uncharacterized lipoprotein NlpE involved in copper resistance